MNPSVPREDERAAYDERRALVRARWRFTLIPLVAMGILLAIFVPPALFGDLDYAAVVPLFLSMGAVVVLFIGSWYDFGAKGFVRDLLRARQQVTMEDVDRIHKEQFVLTLCYGGVAGLYVVVALAIAFL